MLRTLLVVAVLSQIATACVAMWAILKGPTRRVWLALICLALAVAGSFATTWTALRRPDTAVVPARVDTAPPPPQPRASIRVRTREVTSMDVNQLVKVSIGIENAGDRTATDVRRVQMVNFILSPYGEDEAFRLLRAELQSASGERETVAPAGRASFTIEGPRLVAADFPPRGSDDPQVVRDSRPLLVAGIIRYRADEQSEAVAEYCFYAMNARVLVACPGHNN